MRIPAPKIEQGEIALVHNYRSKRKDGKELWEEARCTALRYGKSFGDWSWSYDFSTIRKGKRGYPIYLYVGDDGVRKRCT